MTDEKSRVHALLADGTTVSIRAVGPDDHDGVQRLYVEMSPENLRLRFFGASRRSTEQAAARLAKAALPGYRALGAEHAGCLIGIAEYEELPEAATEAFRDLPSGSRTAEIALAVADPWHHRGVGTLLLEHLISTARADGIAAFTADALAENHEVLKVFADLGLRTSRHFDGPEVRCIVRLAETDDYLSCVEERGRAADVASLRPLLRPQSVAVVGAGRRPGSVGRAVLRNLRGAGFPGRLLAVNPNADAVLGVPASPTVGSLPKTPDLAVLAVPAPEIPAVAEDCGKRGVHALVVVSAGLDEGQARTLLAHCRAYGMRLVGPNCLGIANPEDGTRLDATFAAAHPLPGTAGVAAQRRRHAPRPHRRPGLPGPSSGRRPGRPVHLRRTARLLPHCAAPVGLGRDRGRGRVCRRTAARQRRACRPQGLLARAGAQDAGGRRPPRPAR
ncbi:hypothetical protein GCM10018966_040440 [Streptomyces yanii]